MIAILLCSVVTPALVNQLYVLPKGFNIENVYSYNSLSALLQTGCYIMLTKQYISNLNLKERGIKLLSVISISTFGVYLLHRFFTEAYLNKVSDNILLKTPILVISIFVICSIIAITIKWGRGFITERYKSYSWKKRKFILSLCAIWGGVFIITLFNAGLYGDGNYFAITFLKNGTWEPPANQYVLSRGLVQYSNAIFAYLLLKLGVSNAIMLIHAYSFGLIFRFAVFVTLSLYICYKYHSDEKLLNHTIIISSLSLALCGLYSVHESLTAMSIIWFIFICVCSWDIISQKKVWIIFLTAVLLSVFFGTHETFGLIGPIIVMYYFVQRIKNKSGFSKGGLAIIALVLLNSIYEIYWIIASRGSAGEQGFINLLFQQDNKLVALLVCLALFLLWTEALFSRKKTKATLFFEGVLSALFFVYIVCDPLRLATDCQNVRIMFNTVVPLLFVVYEIFLLLVHKSETYNNNMLCSVLSISCLIAVFGYGTGYHKYLNNLNDLTNSSYGFITYDVMGGSMENDTAYYTQWTIPNESVLSSDPVIYRDDSAGELLNICFSDGSNSARKYITEGISHGEAGFTWTDGKHLKLKAVQIENYSGKHAYTLKLNVGATYHTPQEIIVFCSGQEVFRTTVQKEGGVVMAPLKANEAGLLDIKINLPNAISPDLVEHTGDTRNLALLLIDASLIAE